VAGPHRLGFHNLRFMNYHRPTGKLIAAFAAAVIVPGAILGVLAIRTLRYEETYLKKGLEDTLRIEVDQVVNSIRREIGVLSDELARGLGPLEEDNPGPTFAEWKATDALVGIPFLVSAENRILWPRRDKAMSPAEDAFLLDNQDFLNDRAEILAYENVALLPAAVEVVAVKSGSAAAGEAEDFSVSGREPAGAPPAQLRENLAVAKFRGSREIQSQRYQQAREEKKEVFSRNVLVAREEAEESEPEKSILVAGPLNFSRITAGSERGFIPRLTGDKLELFFWKKLSPAGEIAGCLVNLEEFTRRLLAVLPVPYSASRLLTVLDQNGTPLLDPLEEGASRRWQRPFFAREIGEFLPRWEVTAYLSDPSALASRARLQSLLTAVLIGTLLVAILLGGFLIFRAVNQQIVLAQEKTTFAANVSHELKTPLTSIRLFAEMLEQGRQPDPDKQRYYLKTMAAESKRLSRLINTVLDFSRIERGEKTYRREKVDLALVVKRVFENLRIRLEEAGFSCRLLVPEEPVPVRGDPEALEQVLVNLLSNAEKYSEKIREIELAVEKGDGAATVTVSDRGIGVPKAAAKKIFSKFYRADDSLTSRVKGTGLGLTIAQAIVREHSGELAYQPREGGGSRFRLRLPLLKD